MIVTCEECATSFQLDESRIPETGARVRCSRCKHAFFLPNPSASQVQVADAIAEEAADDPMANVPTSAPDLSSSALGDPLSSASGVVPPEAAESEEEDWQFSEEIRIEGDDDLDAPEDSESSGVFGTALDVEASAEDFSADDLKDSDFEEAAPAEADARDESDFGSVDDFSSLMEEDDASPIDLASDIESEMEIEQSPEPISNVYSAPGTSDDLGDPESWDLVGSDDFAVSGPPVGLVQGLTGQAAAVAEEFNDDDADAVRYDEETGSTSKLWQTLSSVGRGVGWAATIVMVGAVLFSGLQREWTRGDQTSQIVSLGGMTAQTTQAKWVETSRSGYVLVVEGEIRNDGADSLWPGTLQLALLDSSGARLTEEPIRIGEPLSALVLREGSPAVLQSTARAASLRLRNAPLAAGETRAFEAIAFEDRLPETATRVLLEMSGPGVVTPLQPIVQSRDGAVQPDGAVEPIGAVQPDDGAVQPDDGAVQLD